MFLRILIFFLSKTTFLKISHLFSEFLDLSQIRDFPSELHLYFLRILSLISKYTLKTFSQVYDHFLRTRTFLKNSQVSHFFFVRISTFV